MAGVEDHVIVVPELKPEVKAAMDTAATRNVVSICRQFGRSDEDTTEILEILGLVTVP